MRRVFSLNARMQLHMRALDKDAICDAPSRISYFGSQGGAKIVDDFSTPYAFFS
jgi:hypothetical protein